MYLHKSEMTYWWQHYSEMIPTFQSDSDRKEVEYATGRIPLFLRALFIFSGKPYGEIRDELLSKGILRSVRDNAKQFVEKKLEGISTNSHICTAYVSASNYKGSNDTHCSYSFIQNMKACILESPLETCSIRKDLVNRYFYFANNIGHCVCGVVREAVSTVLLQHFPDFLQGDDWLDVVAKDSMDNPTLRGFLVERVCLSHIATYGLKIVDGKLEAMLMYYFWDVPDWGVLMKATGRATRQLFVPTRFNYEAIDGIIAHLNKGRKSLALYPIQITIAKDHSDSEEKFFLKWWLKYVDAIHSRFGTDYSITVTFIWIHKDQEHITNVEKDVPVEACGVVNKYKLYKLPVTNIITDLDVDHL